MDAAWTHPFAFLLMFVVMLPVCLTRVARATKIPAAKWIAFLNLWMLGYLVVQVALMALTTSIALFFLYDEKGGPKIAE